MANNLQKVHGDVQPVFQMDTANGAIPAATAANGTEVNFIGPAMDFFGITFNGAITGECGVGEAVEAALQSIAQLATVMMYQVQAGALMSVAVYPKGAYTAGTLETQLEALGATVGANNFDMQVVTVTDLGFKLAVA